MKQKPFYGEPITEAPRADKEVQVLVEGKLISEAEMKKMMAKKMKGK